LRPCQCPATDGGAVGDDVPRYRDPWHLSEEEFQCQGPLGTAFTWEKGGESRWVEANKYEKVGFNLI